MKAAVEQAVGIRESGKENSGDGEKQSVGAARAYLSTGQVNETEMKEERGRGTRQRVPVTRTGGCDLANKATT